MESSAKTDTIPRAEYLFRRASSARRVPNVAGQPDFREGMALIRRVREADLYGEPEEEMVSRIMVKPAGIRAPLGTIEEFTSASAPSRNLP